jgi:hypothetical protein
MKVYVKAKKEGNEGTEVVVLLSGKGGNEGKGVEVLPSRSYLIVLSK